MKSRTYRGHNIERLFPSGYWEAYVGGRFHKADTLSGIKAVIDEHLD